MFLLEGPHFVRILKTSPQVLHLRVASPGDDFIAQVGDTK